MMIITLKKRRGRSLGNLEERAAGYRREYRTRVEREMVGERRPRRTATVWPVKKKVAHDR